MRDPNSLTEPEKDPASVCSRAAARPGEGSDGGMHGNGSARPASSTMAAKRETDDQPKAPHSPGTREHLAGDRELWERFARDRDPASREELVRRNMAFAKRLALRYRGASESFDD